MSACDLIALVRSLEADHGPGGWPAVEMATLSALADEIERLRSAAEKARAALSDLLASRDPVVYSDALAALDAALGHHQ